MNLISIKWIGALLLIFMTLSGCAYYGYGYDHHAYRHNGYNHGYSHHRDYDNQHNRHD
jgi:hypothetical protein